MSNTSPPTLLLALHCTWMSCAFVAAAGPVRRWAQRPRVWQFVAVGNGGAMTLYLWHIPAIAVATFTLHAVGFDAYNVEAQGFWGMLALRAGVFAVVMAAAFLVLSPLEHRRLPWWDTAARATGVRSTAAGVLICLAGVALVLLAKNGHGRRGRIHPAGGFHGLRGRSARQRRRVSPSHGAGCMHRRSRKHSGLVTACSVGNVEHDDPNYAPVQRPFTATGEIGSTRAGPGDCVRYWGCRRRRPVSGGFWSTSCNVAGDPLDHDAFDITDASTAAPVATARRVRDIATASGYTVDSVHVTSSGNLSSLRDALTQNGFPDVVPVPL